MVGRVVGDRGGHHRVGVVLRWVVAAHCCEETLTVGEAWALSRGVRILCIAVMQL